MVQYLGWFNHTRLPNVELVCQCTQRKRLLTIASDWAENLSFLSSLRTVSGACNIDPPSLLDSAPANVQQTCDP